MRAPRDGPRDEPRGALAGALAVALLVGTVHLAAAYLALRALLAAVGTGRGGSVALHAAVALLTFPLFHTPLPALFGGRPHTGLYVAILNALLWGTAAWALARRRARRGRRIRR